MYKAFFSKLSVFLTLLFTILLFASCQPKGKTTEDSSMGYTIGYEGLYKGTYPCADCSGIQVSLTLNNVSSI